MMPVKKATTLWYHHVYQNLHSLPSQGFELGLILASFFEVLFSHENPFCDSFSRFEGGDFPCSRCAVAVILFSPIINQPRQKVLVYLEPCTSLRGLLGVMSYHIEFVGWGWGAWEEEGVGGGLI